MNLMSFSLSRGNASFAWFKFNWKNNEKVHGKMKKMNDSFRTNI